MISSFASRNLFHRLKKCKECMQVVLTALLVIEEVVTDLHIYQGNCMQPSKNEMYFWEKKVVHASYTLPLVWKSQRGSIGLYVFAWIYCKNNLWEVRKLLERKQVETDPGRWIGMNGWMMVRGRLLPLCSVFDSGNVWIHTYF